MGKWYEPKPKKKEYWYFIHTWTCPQCGHSKQYRERRSGKKPDDYSKCHEEREYWCGCGW